MSSWILFGTLLKVKELFLISNRLNQDMASEHLDERNETSIEAKNESIQTAKIKALIFYNVNMEGK